MKHPAIHCVAQRGAWVVCWFLSVLTMTAQPVSWKQIPTYQDTRVSVIGVSPQAYILATLGIYISRGDLNGEHWRVVSMEPGSVTGFAFHPSSIVFASTTWSGVSISTDQGDTWKYVLRAPGWPGMMHATSLAFNSRGDVFAGSMRYGVYASTDTGKTWNHLGAILAVSPVYAIAVNSDNHLFVGTGTCLARSTDDGANWTIIDSNMVVPPVLSLAVDRSGTIFAGGVGSVSRSTDNGMSWTRLSTGVDSSITINHIVVASDQSIYIGTDGAGVLWSSNRGDEWRLINTNLSDLAVRDMDASQFGGIFLTSGDGRIFRSSNRLEPPPPPKPFSPRDKTACLTSEVVLSWHDVSGVSTYYLQLGTDSRFRPGSVVIDTTLAATYDTLRGLRFRMRYWWRVAAGNAAGKSDWSAPLSFSTMAEPPRAPLVISPGTGDTIDIRVAQLSWEPIECARAYHLQVAADSMFAPGNMIVDSVLEKHVYTLRGLKFSQHYYWRLKAEFEHATGPWSPAASFFIYQAILSTPLPEAPPASPRLGRCYPNPVRSVAAIPFSISRAGPVSLEIHSMLGRRVSVVMNAFLEPGSYSVRWKSASFPNGAYIVVLRASSRTRTETLVISR